MFHKVGCLFNQSVTLYSNIITSYQSYKIDALEGWLEQLLGENFGYFGPVDWQFTSDFLYFLLRWLFGHDGVIL